MTHAAVLAVFLFALGAAAQDAPPPAGETPPAAETEAGDPEALLALKEGVEFSKAKSYRFKATLDVEVGGAPMMSLEVAGVHVKPWLHVRTDLMGRAFEAWSDGTSTFSREADGEWKPGGAVMRGALALDVLASAVTSATFDAKEVTVGSHVCRVLRAQADADALRRGLGGGRGGQGEVKSSSLKFYLDKDDGRLRKVKLTMTADATIQGAEAEIEILLEQRYTYSKSLTLELPEEVRKLLEEGPGPGDSEGEGSGK